MITAFGAARLGRDAELRYTQNGDPVTTLALAFNYGKRGGEGNRQTTWIDGSLWGKRAESLSEYLIKGKQVSVVLDDLHIETYEGRNGPGSKLVARVTELELGGGGESEEARQHPQYAGPSSNQYAPQAPQVPQQRRIPQVAQRPPPPRREPARAPAPSTGGGDSGFDDMDDDVPF